MIYDKTHQAMLVHEAGKEWVIWEHIEAFDETKLKLSDNEKEMSRGWQIFFDTIAIQERKNEKLQQQLLPLKYRPYQTEHLEKEEKCALFPNRSDVSCQMLLFCCFYIKSKNHIDK